MRPGIAGGEVFDTTVAAVEQAGLPAFDRHHVGHGIGLEAAEAPWLAPGGGALEMGMVLRVETPWYVVGEAGLNVKETALVTRTGAHYSIGQSRYDRSGLFARGRPLNSSPPRQESLGGSVDGVPDCSASN